MVALAHAAAYGMKPEQTCNGGDRATRLGRRHYTPTSAALPHDDPDEMDELANEAGADRPTEDSASAESGLGAARHLRGEQHPPQATTWLKKGNDSESLLPPNG